MSWSVRRAVVLLGLGTATGIGSALIWPGDPDGPLSATHLIAIGGFLLTAALLLMAAGLVFVAVLGEAWSVSNFKPTEYLARMKRRR